MRKIIQIATALIPETELSSLEQVTVALCDDGSVWGFSSQDKKWSLYPEIPQDRPEYEIYLNTNIDKLIKKERSIGLSESEKEELVSHLSSLKSYELHRI